MKQFIDKNKVFLLGLLGAIALVLQQYVGQVDLSWKVVGYAAFVTAVTYVARTARGQWQTIAAAVGTLASTFVTMEQAGTISWNQLILQAIIVLIGIATGPVKPVGYEQTTVIMQAKEKGLQITEQKKANG